MGFITKHAAAAAGLLTMLAAVGEAHAAFTYDLRFAPGQTGVADAHDATISAGGTYTLQLWGQITGDTNLTNDGWVEGFVAIDSSQSEGGAFTSGGVTGASLGTHVQAAAGGPTIGTGGTDINGDGITDWGSNSTASVSGWLKWVGGANPGYADGVADSQSEQVNSNTWEVLLATFTVNANNVTTTGGTTTFNVFTVTGIKSGLSTLDGLDYTLDGATSPTKVVTATNSVVFTSAANSVPEPASLGLLALGTAGFLPRRKRA